MKQILHIFRKDVRKHRLEIAASLLLLVGFAWKSPLIWNDDSRYANQASRILFGLAGLSLVLSWWFLIIRVIQGESLVGDRQFWLTRPYRRHCLLAAKILFIILFVNVPVLIFDVVSLWRAGFSPWQQVPGLLQAQLLLTAFLIIPIATISAVTETIAQFLLIFLGVIIFFVGLSWIAGEIPSSSAGGGIPGAIVMTVLACTCAASIALQYFRRDTRLSRYLILGSLCAVAVTLIAAPYNRLVEHAYPQVQGGSFTPIRTMIKRATPRQHDDAPFYGKTVSLTTNINTDGLGDGSLVVIDAARLSIYASDGRAWNSGWFGPQDMVWPNTNLFRRTFNVDRKFYSSVGAEDVRLRVELAVSQYHEHFIQQVATTAADFRVTNDAICSGDHVRIWHSINCRVAINQPAYTARLNPLDTTCTLPDASWPSLEVQRYAGDVSSDFGGGAGLFPVRTFDIYFGAAVDPADKKSAAIICPGTKFELAKPVPVGQYRIESEVQAVRLADYLSEYDLK